MALVTGVFVVLVLAIVGVLLVVKVTRGSTVATPPAVTPAPGTVVQQVSSVPAATWATVGAPSPTGPPPSVLSRRRPLVLDGRPGVLFVGSEFSPYSAAMRWALVVALSRFGTFAHLGATTSSSAEVFSGISTFSFVGTTFHSRYLALSAVEEYGPALDSTEPAGFPLLRRPPGWAQRLMRLDDDGAEVPFLDIDNRVVMVGAETGFSPGVLQGRSMAQIAGQLASPTTSVAEAVVGEANVITAAICQATGQRPGPVCRSSGADAGALRLGLSAPG